jgi:processive 1,2-diacylglycerol beta-glucosyltransferase
MGGGRGLFDVDKDFFYWIDEFISEYDNCLDVTIVTGSNKKLFEELTQKKPLLNINVLGYVNNLYDLVKSYDLIITKPGGATLFESIHSQTPIIVKLPKIGQEIENAKFIMDNGLGIIYYDEKDLKTIISSLPDGNFDNIIEYIQSNITYFKQSIHPEKIYDYILELINNKN